MKRIFLAVAAFLLLSGCRPVGLDSVWPEREIVIDGRDQEWTVTPQYAESRKGVSLAVMNDDDCIYLHLATDNPAVIRAIELLGLQIRLSTDSETMLGINYPLGRQTTGFPAQRQMMDPQKLKAMQRYLENRVEIIGPRPGLNRFFNRTELPDTGIALAMHESEGLLAYELKIPLVAQEPDIYAISRKACSTLDLTIQTGQTGPEPAGSRGKVPRPGKKNGDRDDNPDLDPPAEKGQPKKIELRVKVHLAKFARPGKTLTYTAPDTPQR